MEIVVESGTFESRTYRRILEFIQREGIESFIRFVDDVHSMSETSLIENAIYKGTHKTLRIVRNNKLVIEFLRDFQDSFLDYSVSSRQFREFVFYVFENIDKLDLFLENARKLEDLKVCTVNISNPRSLSFARFRTQVFTDPEGNITDIIKNYSDGIIKYRRVFNEPDYKDYELEVYPAFGYCIDPTWILTSENHANGRQFRYAQISGFNFNAELLPSSEELSSYEEPEDLKAFRRTLE